MGNYVHINAEFCRILHTFLSIDCVKNEGEREGDRISYIVEKI